MQHDLAPAHAPAPPQVLEGFRIFSLGLNLPAPAALMRCQQMGARCTKLEPPNGDPMAQYSAPAYAQLHDGIEILQLDLKGSAGQAQLHERLAATDVLLSSFRPSALTKLGLNWEALQARHPHLSQVAIVGGPGALAEHAGHDLTYLAGQDLVLDLDLPTTLYADMTGSLMASEAVLQAALLRRSQPSSPGVYLEVALSQAAAYAALPRHWGLTTAGGMVGGAHAGYAVYACLDGRVAVAALEPHFARSLGQAAGLDACTVQDMLKPQTRAHLARFFASRTRQELDALAQTQDIPLLTLQ